MASVVCCKMLQQGSGPQMPHVQRVGSFAETWNIQKVVSLIKRSPTTRRTPKRGGKFALGLSSILASRGRRPCAASGSVSGIENVDVRADRTEADVTAETQAKLERAEARDPSVAGDSPPYLADFSQKSEEGSAEDSKAGRIRKNRREGSEEHSSRSQGAAKDKYGGSAEDRDEGCEEANLDRGSTDNVTAEGTISISESKRIRRSRIMKELLQRGTSPIELLESTGECTPELFWTTVNILCLHSRAPEALLVFDWWKRQEGYVASEQQYTGFISICGRAKLTDKAQQLFDEMIKLDFRPTVATYSCLLQGFAEAEDFDKAKGILAEMRELGLNPNAITYTGLLYAYGKQGYYSEMAKIFNDMKTYQISQPECAPTSVTYSALLQCYARGGLFARMEKALKEMRSKELEPDGSAVNAMIQGYAEAGLLKDMEKAYSQVRPYNVTVRVETLRAVARAYIRKSYFYQLGTFARYHNRQRVSMGNLIENLLLLSHAANFSMRGLAEEYVRLKGNGFEGDITSFNIRSLAFSRMQMLWDLRVTVLEMVHQNVMPDIVTYGAVVDAYVTGDLQSSLSEALAEMPNLNRLARVQTDELVFDAFGRGDFQICCEELSLESQDVDRRFLTYTNLVGYHLKRLEILSARNVKKKSNKL